MLGHLRRLWGYDVTLSGVEGERVLYEASTVPARTADKDAAADGQG